MKTAFLLLSLSTLAATPAAAQTTPTAPGIGPNYRIPRRAAPPYQGPVKQTKVYQVGSGASSYQTRPNALRVAVPDTITERPMPRMPLPTTATDDRSVFPLSPQRRE